MEAIMEHFLEKHSINTEKAKMEMTKLRPT